MTAPRILDCTIRDGSYVVDFQFTAEDTAVIAAGLDRAGIGWIEVGHGLGLNAAASGKGAAAATDEAYLRAAADSIRHAQWGMFFIPGIGRIQDLDLAADYGMKFVRIGANAPDIAQTEPYVTHALRRGLHVSVNLMKSYAVPPDRLIELSALAQGFGAHVVSLVDSAGTMLPADVRGYVSRMRDALTVEVGFHGHDNLALGMANVLAAIESGAAVVDTTVQGIGRGGGNPVTEILVAILHKQGIATGVDLNQLLDLSERVVRPLLKGKGHDALNITSGLAGFHSSALQLILKHADRYHIDPRDLIVAVSGIDRVEVTDALVDSVAGDLSRQRRGQSGTHVVDLPRPPAGAGRGAPESFAEAAIEAVRTARAVATKSGRLCVFNVVGAAAPSAGASVSAFVQEEFAAVIASAQMHDPRAAAALAAAIDGEVDAWFVDADPQAGGWSAAGTLRPLIHRSRFLVYRDSDTWIRAVELQIAALATAAGRRVLVIGEDVMASRLALGLAERGFSITICADAGGAAVVEGIRRLSRPDVDVAAAADPVSAAATAQVLVAFGRNTIAEAVVDALPDGALVFDAGIGALRPAAVAAADRRRWSIIRPDMRAVLAAELTAALGTERIATELMGRGELAGVPVVAGGVVGRAGDVVLDSMSNPGRVLGVADGAGGVNYWPSGDAAERVRQVQQAIWRQKLSPEVH